MSRANYYLVWFSTVFGAFALGLALVAACVPVSRSRAPAPPSAALGWEAMQVTVICSDTRRGGTASAVAIGPRRALTAWHVVADCPSERVALLTGVTDEARLFSLARVVRGELDGDAALLELETGVPDFEAWLQPGEMEVGSWVCSNPTVPRREVKCGRVLEELTIDLEGRLIDGYRLRLVSPHGSSEPGNSGAAVVDRRGRLVGLVVGSFRDSDTAAAVKVPAWHSL